MDAPRACHIKLASGLRGVIHFARAGQMQSFWSCTGMPLEEAPLIKAGVLSKVPSGDVFISGTLAGHKGNTSSDLVGIVAIHVDDLKKR